MSQARIQVRGYTLFDRQASIKQRTIALFSDLCLIFSVNLAVADLFHLSPFINLKIIFLFISLSVIYFLSHGSLEKPTIGQRIWRLRKVSQRNIEDQLEGAQKESNSNSKSGISKAIQALKPSRLYTQNLPDRISLYTSMVLTLSFLVLSLYSIHRWVIQHPIWLKSSVWELKSFLPPPSNSPAIFAGNQWTITPFFYTLGGWPKRFNGRQVLYTLPYENGPPNRFIGRVIARLDRTDLKLVIEGPKTPEGGASQKQIRDCFSKEHFGILSAYQCLKIKDQTLKRHLDEMRTFSSTSPRSWKIKWFQIENPELPTDDQTQGIYLSGVGKDSIQDRFILVNQNGTNQCIILNRPQTQIGDQAFEFIQNTVASLRIFPDLLSGRAWINNKLANIHLDHLKEIQSDELVVNQLEEIQTLLISSISVDPSQFESYFHLAGTSLMLTKKSIHSQDGKNVSALENIKSSYQFAKDVAPNDPRTPEIQNYWLEARKF